MSAIVPVDIPPRGHFDHLCVAGSFAPAVENALRTRNHHGLVQESTGAYGTFRDRDGVVIVVNRVMGWDWARPLVVRRGTGGELAIDRGIAARSWSGSGLKDEVRGTSHSYQGGADRGGFRLRWSPEEISWEERETLNVTGFSASDVGLQWHDPSPPGAAYSAMFFRARGEILGRAVEGFVVFEQRYLPSGRLWRHSPHAGPGLLHSWATFATEWDDGSMEAGVLCAGHRSWGVAMIARSGRPALVTTDIGADRAGPGSPVSFLVEDERWEWQPGASLAPFRPLESVAPWEGLVRRGSEQRHPRVWMGRLELPGEGSR